MSVGILDIFQMLNLSSLVDFLNNSSFDELIDLNYAENSFKFIYNIDKKYILPQTSGQIDDFCGFAADHLIFPADREQYLAMMDAGTIFDRLESSAFPGVLTLDYRAKNTEGDWRQLKQILIGGKQHSVEKGHVLCYIFDIQNRVDRLTGSSLVTDRSAEPDPLTGLLQQKDFFASAEKTRASFGEHFIFASLDLENFMIFNDWYGRENGNNVLAVIGRCFKETAEECGGIAGYFGQDDFCIILPEKTVTVNDLYARTVNASKKYGVSLGFLPLIGYAVADNSVSLLNLYDRAALACQKAKGDFKNRIRCFDPSMYKQTAEDFHILSDFQRALREGEITFYLQPQCRASTGKIVGAESLARWRRSDGSFVSPAVFVPVLEKYGLVADLDKYVWEDVCKWQKKRSDAGEFLIPVSVNISLIDIFTIDVPDHFSGLITKYDLPPKSLKIEITESACAENSDVVRSTIQELRRRGFTVIMDDFGSGYSSLNVLHEMSFDVIKLDAKFLRMNKDSAEKGMHILESVVNMAKTLDVPIIVEGVETEDQKDYLMSIGCRYIQGFYFYRPMPPAGFERLVSSPDAIDTAGFVAKSNEQFRVREFLNDTVYSDAMLNNIIGPVAIYSWKDGHVDIIRYNQQFYETVGVKDFGSRLCSIEQFMPAQDAEELHAMLRKAMQDRLNGATSGVLNFSRSDGKTSRFLIHFYFLGETDGCKRFYGSTRDVTEITNLNNHMRIMERYFSGTIIFLLRSNNGFDFQIGAHGLGDYLQISRTQLEHELTSGQFFARVAEEDAKSLHEMTKRSVSEGVSFETAFRMNTPGGVRKLFMKCDRVDDPSNDVQCIISITRVIEKGDRE
ncbi:MAG: EAL domain-containing protein [Clostridia bacterium]|nr:EAL domain-containing protein [Clostridia bacterium]